MRTRFERFQRAGQPTEELPAVAWGKPYGRDPFYTSQGHWAWMFRKGQRVRFFNAQGRQVGPEQRNVAPAIVYTIRKGWIPAGTLPEHFWMLAQGRKEVSSGCRRKRR